MKLEHQVVSLDLAKKLKELDVEQESHFWWICTLGQWDLVAENDRSKEDRFSAYTVAELGKLLPRSRQSLWKSGADLMHGELYGGFYCSDKNYDCIADDEADARAKMLIYLIENNLI